MTVTQREKIQQTEVNTIIHACTHANDWESRDKVLQIMSCDLDTQNYYDLKIELAQIKSNIKPQTKRSFVECRKLQRDIEKFIQQAREAEEFGAQIEAQTMLDGHRITAQSYYRIEREFALLKAHYDVQQFTKAV